MLWGPRTGPAWWPGCGLLQCTLQPNPNPVHVGHTVILKRQTVCPTQPRCGALSPRIPKHVPCYTMPAMPMQRPGMMDHAARDTEPAARARWVDKQGGERWRTAQAAKGGGSCDGPHQGSGSSAVRLEDRWMSPEERNAPRVLGGSDARARHGSRWDDEERRAGRASQPPGFPHKPHAGSHSYHPSEAAGKSPTCMWRGLHQSRCTACPARPVRVPFASLLPVIHPPLRHCSPPVACCCWSPVLCKHTPSLWEPGWCAYSHVRKRTQAESGKHVESVCPWHVGFPLKEGEGWGSEGGPPVLAAMPPPGSGLLILWLRPRPRRYLRPSAPAHVFAEDSSPAWMAPEPVPPAKMTPADIERERQAFREQHSRAKQQAGAQKVRRARGLGLCCL